MKIKPIKPIEILYGTDEGWGNRTVLDSMEITPIYKEVFKTVPPTLKYKGVQEGEFKTITWLIIGSRSYFLTYTKKEIAGTVHNIYLLFDELGDAYFRNHFGGRRLFTHNKTAFKEIYEDLKIKPSKKFLAEKIYLFKQHLNH